MDVDREAKYLHKAISPRDQIPAEPISDDEIDSLYRFRQAPEAEQEVLASFSQKLRKRDKRSWDVWMKKPGCRAGDRREKGPSFIR